MKRVIITGPTGTIGMALMKKCIQEKVEVLAIVNPKSGRKNIIYQNSLITVIEKDIADYKSLVFDKTYDIWFHLAWCGASGVGRNDMYLQNNNVRYMLDAIEAAERAGCQVFLGAGSQAEYGPSDIALNGRAATFPVNGYGMAKLCAGQMGRRVCEEKGIRFIWTRIFSVYGPYDGENTMIISTIKRLLKGEIPQFTKGEQQWDYLYSEDAADLLLELAQKGKKEKVYCIGSGKTRPLAEYITIIRNLINPDASIELGAIDYSENQVMYLCADIEDVVLDTGYDSFTPFEIGIGKTIEWYQNERKSINQRVMKRPLVIE